MTHRLPAALAAALALIGVAFAARTPAAQEHAAQDSMSPTIYPLAEIKWGEGPPALPRGAQLAVLEGDPSKAGPFTFRIKLPDGYRIPPHTHPKTERVTVIEGTFHLGMGERFDESKGTTMPAGTYGYWPAGMKHFAWAEGEVILQLHGEGPWGINYLNPADDPRNSAQ